MKYNTLKKISDKDFDIEGMSYIGNPISHTAMFITKKIEDKLSALEDVTNCLVFAEEGMNVSEELLSKHAFIFSKKPNLEYARFANEFATERNNIERKLKVKLMPGGYYIYEDSKVGDNAYIQPGVVIGPDVVIGDNAVILAGSKIRHSRIGHNLVCNEDAIIGANGFTMAEDESGDKFRIPSLGKVIIGDNVEIGVNDNISCGSGGDTVIEDNVKIDALVHIGHDVRLHKNVEITAGAIIGGFDDLGEKAYVGINAVLRNRITIGDNAIVGMGSTVTKSVDSNVTVAGNPARLFSK